MEGKYYTTIGLEIHAELKTLTKMFCACKNDPDEKKPNVNICPVCMAHPGALPVINKKAVEHVIKVGLALGADIADFTEFDRKNYFYPDIPKGYQISQYKYPIVSGGQLARFDITRVHLEEDTGTNKHDRGDFSLIDFNRAGIPLMELVTEPHTFEKAEEAAKVASHFAKELQLILWYLGVSEANMEKGEMRVEVNISISPDPKTLGTKVEVKNLNSFRSVERAALYEFDRMQELMDRGKANEIVQETRGFDESKQKTFSQRKKESSHDYRYFPDPDLPKLKLHEAFDLGKMKRELPELPEVMRVRYKNDFSIKDEDIEVYINDPELGARFSAIAENLAPSSKVKTASNFITSDFLGLKKSKANISFPSVQNFVELVNLFADGVISSRTAKDLLAMIAEKDESPFRIATAKGLLQENNQEAIDQIAQKVVNQNSKVVADINAGKENAIMSLVGQMMRETKGAINPQVAKSSILEAINKK